MVFLWLHGLHTIMGHANDRQKVMRTTRKRDIDMDGHRDRDTDRQKFLNGPRWGPLDPSVGINAPQFWTLTLEINKIKNRKRPVDDRTTNGRTDGQTDGRRDGETDGRIAKKWWGQPERETDGRTDRRTDGWRDRRADGHIYCHSGGLTVWPAAACAEHN